MSKNTFNILIVEDEIFARQYLLAILEELGYINIFEVNNSNDAKITVEENTIHLVFMDINIKGGTDGIQCANILNNCYEIPIIYTTAYCDSQTIQETTQTNIYGYLIKPFNESNVEATLSIAMKKIEEKRIPIITHEKETLLLTNELSFDVNTQTLYKKDIAYKLTRKELLFVNLFIQYINQNVSYEMIQNIIWKEKKVSHSTVRDSISRVKKKIPDLQIENVVGYGYILRSI